MVELRCCRAARYRSTHCREHSSLTVFSAARVAHRMQRSFTSSNKLHSNKGTCLAHSLPVPRTPSSCSSSALQAPTYTPQPAAQSAPQQPQQYAQPTPTQQYAPPAQPPSATPQPAAPMQMDPQQQYAQQQAAAAAQGAEGMQHLTEAPQQHVEPAQGGAPGQAYTAQPVDGGAAAAGYDGNAQQAAAGQQVEYGAPIEQQQVQAVHGDAGMAVEEGGAAA